MSDRELGIYLNDHISGATAGLETARRAVSNSTDPERTRMWRDFEAQVSDERELLKAIRDRIEAKPNIPKYAIAWAGEKLGRLKLNGRLIRQSDLGQMLELEMLVVGVTGKLSLWRALERLEDPRLSAFDFNDLASQAEAQRSRLEQFRINLVPAALGDRSTSASKPEESKLEA
ncbi:MAG: hypothetical protein KDB54_12150 [Solirubrobacterales bacterium]|nr:hypothetical protein [Solirubrobacterales bacterium]MCB0861393.1 hypothetical protein [Solirubrobacterales bacterium]